MKKRRLFLALWPDAGVRRQLEHLIEKNLHIRGGRLEPIDNLHVTLVFIGNVESGRVAVIEQALAGVQGNAFELVLDRIGYWERPRILWLGPRQVPPAVLSLVKELYAVLEPCGVTAETRPYLPHITLARKVRHPPREINIEPISWSVGAYSLMESVPLERGSAYRELAAWPLRSGDKPHEPTGIKEALI